MIICSFHYFKYLLPILRTQVHRQTYDSYIFLLQDICYFQGRKPFFLLFLKAKTWFRFRFLKTVLTDHGSGFTELTKVLISVFQTRYVLLNLLYIIYIVIPLDITLININDRAQDESLSNDCFWVKNKKNHFFNYHIVYINPTVLERCLRKVTRNYVQNCIGTINGDLYAVSGVQP